jgi:hypothetical protein
MFKKAPPDQNAKIQKILAIEKIGMVHPPCPTRSDLVCLKFSMAKNKSQAKNQKIMGQIC